MDSIQNRYRLLPDLAATRLCKKGKRKKSMCHMDWIQNKVPTGTRACCSLVVHTVHTACVHSIQGTTRITSKRKNKQTMVWPWDGITSGRKIDLGDFGCGSCGRGIAWEPETETFWRKWCDYHKWRTGHWTGPEKWISCGCHSLMIKLAKEEEPANLNCNGQEQNKKHRHHGKGYQCLPNKGSKDYFNLRIRWWKHWGIARLKILRNCYKAL